MRRITHPCYGFETRGHALQVNLIRLKGHESEQISQISQVALNYRTTKKSMSEKIQRCFEHDLMNLITDDAPGISR